MALERRHLEHLAAVTDHGSVTRAAEALGITQPALSRSIHEIERVLGVRCFDRLPQGVAPTPACLALVDRARAVLEQFQAFEGTAQRLGERYEGTVAVGFGPAVGASGLSRELGRFLGLHPQLRARVALDAPDALVERLRRRELELVVADCTALVDDGAFVFEPVEYEALFLCRPGHPLLAEKDPERELTRYPIALMGPPASGLAAMRAFLAAADPGLAPSWEPALALDGAPALRDILLDGDFVGASAAHAHAEDLRSGTLRCVPVSRSPYRGRVGPIRMRDRTPSPAAEALWKLLAESLRLDVATAAALAARPA
jgi:LysR family pca operon transcriptional activator